MIKYIILIFSLLFYQKIYASEIVGFPKVVDGDTLHIESYKIRLEGIDAPEMKQKCKKPYLQIIFSIFKKIIIADKSQKKNLYKKLLNIK